MKFTISTTNHQHLHVSSVELNPSDDEVQKLDILSGRLQNLIVRLMSVSMIQVLMTMARRSHLRSPLALHFT